MFGLRSRAMIMRNIGLALQSIKTSVSLVPHAARTRGRSSKRRPKASALVDGRIDFAVTGRRQCTAVRAVQRAVAGLFRDVARMSEATSFVPGCRRCAPHPGYGQRPGVHAL